MSERGPRGFTGEQGAPGPRPDHRWQNTKLQLEAPDGEWGDAIDLRGPSGEQGIPGTVGATGEKGDRGETGSPGLHGKTGLQGSKGLDGPRGPRGQVGPPGPQGEHGRGIESVEIRSGDLLVRFDDGTEQNVGKVVGPAGSAGHTLVYGGGGKGATGPVGPAGPAGPSTGGGTLDYIAGEDVAIYLAASIMIDGTVGTFDIEEPERLLGISETSASTGNTVTVRHAGRVENPAWSWSPGGPIYALDDGTLSQTPDVDVAARVGLAISATAVLVRALSPIFTSP